MNFQTGLIIGYAAGSFFEFLNWFFIAPLLTKRKKKYKDAYKPYLRKDDQDDI